MKTNVIRGGEEAFRALVYKPPTQEMINYFNTGLNNIMQTSSMFGNVFVDTVQSLYDRYNSSAVIEAGKAYLYQSGSHLSQDVIYPVPFDGLTQANLIMQQYIMAEPEVNRLYKKDMCYGFQDTYLNLQPGVYGEDRLEYQQVINNLLTFPNGEDHEGRVLCYSGEEFENNPLSMMDRLAILSTWDNVKLMIASGRDPTDPNNGIL